MESARKQALLSAVVVGSNPEQKGRRSVVPLTAVSTQITPGNAGAKQFFCLKFSKCDLLLGTFAQCEANRQWKPIEEKHCRVELNLNC